jgi:hypothetical protein
MLCLNTGPKTISQLNMDWNLWNVSQNKPFLPLSWLSLVFCHSEGKKTNTEKRQRWLFPGENSGQTLCMRWPWSSGGKGESEWKHMETRSLGQSLWHKTWGKAIEQGQSWQFYFPNTSSTPQTPILLISLVHSLHAHIQPCALLYFMFKTTHKFLFWKTHMKENLPPITLIGK